MTFAFYTWLRTLIQQIEYLHVWCLSHFLAKLKLLHEEMSVSIAVRRTMFDLMFSNSGGVIKPQQIHRCQHSQKTNIGIHGCWLATIKELNKKSDAYTCMEHLCDQTRMKLVNSNCYEGGNPLDA